MKTLEFFYRMRLTFDSPVWGHDFALRFVPQSDGVQTITLRRKRVDPFDWLQEDVDAFGNHLFVGRYASEHAHFLYEVEGIARVDALAGLEGPCGRCYLYSTRLTAWKEELAKLCPEPELWKRSRFEIACLLMQRVYDCMTYEPGTTDIHTTAAEALKLKKGVCQDYAHILITLCRHFGIPARYVAGLMIGEGATHAWVEIYDGGRWKGFDPTHNRFVDDVYIKLSQGRDYTDCLLDRGVFYGQANQKQEIYARVREMEEFYDLHGIFRRTSGGGAPADSEKQN